MGGRFAVLVSRHRNPCGQVDVGTIAGAGIAALLVRLEQFDASERDGRIRHHERGRTSGDGRRLRLGGLGALGWRRRDRRRLSCGLARAARQ